MGAVLLILVASQSSLPLAALADSEKKQGTMDKKIRHDAPEGWFLAGTNPEEYKASLDKEKFHSGTRSCRVDCIADKASGWTTLMQNMGPGKYLGKRLRMNFWVCSENVGYVSGWMRVDGSKKEVLAFDNMCNRTVKGDSDWVKQEIVLDIPRESTNIGFGVIFNGNGKMWADDFSFQVVDRETPTTSCPCSPGAVRDKAAQNLDFESD